MNCEAKMSLPVGVPFEVVEVWYNDLYTPYTLLPTRKDIIKNYAIRVAGLYFLLGDENNDSLYICSRRFCGTCCLRLYQHHLNPTHKP